MCKQTLWLAPAPPISAQNPQWLNHAFQSSSTLHYLKTITKTIVVDNFKDIFRWQCGKVALSSFMTIVQLSIYVIFVFCLWHPSNLEWQWCNLTRFQYWWIRHYMMMSVLPLIMILPATKQLFEWFSPSVCPSVRLSVCHTFLIMFPSSYHHEIFMSYYQWQKWRPCKRSRSEVKGQGHRGHNPT